MCIPYDGDSLVSWKLDDRRTFEKNHFPSSCDFPEGFRDPFPGGIRASQRIILATMKQTCPLRFRLRKVRATIAGRATTKISTAAATKAKAIPTSILLLFSPTQDTIKCTHL